MPDLVSILTPAYMAEDTIKRAVSSVLAQTYANWEMIIVSDDGKDYQKILADNGISDSRLRFDSTGKIGSGPSKGRNIALRKSQGDYITLLDADDAYKPSRLELMVDLAKKYGISNDNVEFRDNVTNEIILDEFNRVRPEKEIRFADYIRMRFTLQFMAKRKFMRDGWDEETMFTEDRIFDCVLFEQVPVIGHMDSNNYIYFIRKNSLCHGGLSNEYILKNYKQILKKLEANKFGINSEYIVSYLKKFMSNYIEVNLKYIDYLQYHDYIHFEKFVETHPECQEILDSLMIPD